MSIEAGMTAAWNPRVYRLMRALFLPFSLTQADVAALAVIGDSLLGPLQKFTAEVHQHETLCVSLVNDTDGRG
jgi:hypothetical protein